SIAECRARAQFRRGSPRCGQERALDLGLRRPDVNPTSLWSLFVCTNEPELAGESRRKLRSGPCRADAAGFARRHTDRRSRISEPAVLRLIAPLAVLVIVAIVACTGLAYVLAKQADDYFEAEHRQALAGAVEALQAVSPDLPRV